LKPIYKIIALIALSGMLGLVFAMYGRPDFVLNLTNQIWGCF
jgi:hypothetical protein